MSQTTEERALTDLLATDDGRTNFVHTLMNTLGPEGRARLLSRVVNPPDESEAPGNTDVAALIGARTLSAADKQALEIASLMRFFEYRKALLSTAIPATKVAEMLGVVRQTVHDRLKGGQLLGVMDNNVLKFPDWQFDPEGPNGVVNGLTEVIAALNCNIFAKISWLSTPNSVFAGTHPIDFLKAGAVEEVVREARAVEVV